MSKISMLSQWVLGGGKSASEGAPTSHPVGSAPDGTRPASEGARSAEYTADMKKQNTTQTAETAKASEAAGANIGENAPSAQLNNVVAATGEDKSTETGRAKTTPDDPGTSHAARVDSAKCANLATDGVHLLARLAVITSAGTEKSAAAADTAPKTTEEKKPKTDEVPVTTPETTEKPAACAKQASEADLAAAKSAGARAAGAIADQLGLIAEDEAEILSRVVGGAKAAAARACEYVQTFKKAAMDAQMAAEGGAVPPGAEAAGGMPPGDGAGAAEGGINEEMLMQLSEATGLPPEQIIQILMEAAQGGGEGGEVPPEAAAEGGGMPPEAAAMPPEGEPKAAAQKPAPAAQKPAITVPATLKSANLKSLVAALNSKLEVK